MNRVLSLQSPGMLHFSCRSIRFRFETLDQEQLDHSARRFEAACRVIDPAMRVYQYLLKRRGCTADRIARLSNPVLQQLTGTGWSIFMRRRDPSTPSRRTLPWSTSSSGPRASSPRPKLPGGGDLSMRPRRIPSCSEPRWTAFSMLCGVYLKRGSSLRSEPFCSFAGS